ncbi:N-acetylglucosamine-6-sulfatase, partial [Tetrabaena socialis]
AVKKLECLGILDNTVIIWTSDNGFKLGQHNIPQEKFTYFEEDVALPLFIRGPGVPRGVYAGTVQAAMVDVTATILAYAGAQAPPPYRVDGAPLPLELVAQLNPTPNTPFLTYNGPYWNAPAGTDIAAVPGSQATSCARQPRPPPLPPMAPRPPPCRGGKRCGWVSGPSDDDDSETPFLSMMAKYDAGAGRGAGFASRSRGLLRGGWARAAAAAGAGARAAEAVVAAAVEAGGGAAREERMLQAAAA